MEMSDALENGGYRPANGEVVPTIQEDRASARVGVNNEDIIKGFNTLFEATHTKLSIDFVAQRVLDLCKLNSKSFSRVKCCLSKYLSAGVNPPIYYRGTVRARLKVPDSVDWVVRNAPSAPQASAAARSVPLADTAAPIQLYAGTLSEDSYKQFKLSLLEETPLVREYKRMKGTVTRSKRLYAAFGQKNTGMFYNGIFLTARDQCPTAARIIIEHALANGLKLSRSLCVMFTIYPPTSKEDCQKARGAGKKMEGMSYHADGTDKSQGFYLGDPNDIVVYTYSGFLDPANPGRSVACNDWYFTVRHNKTGTKTPVQLHDNCLLIQPKGMQANYKHKVHGTFNTFMRWVATVRDIDFETLQSWLQRKKRVYYASDYSDEAHLRKWLDLNQQWIISDLVLKSDPRLNKQVENVTLQSCVSCKSQFNKDTHKCSSPVVFGNCDLEVGHSFSREYVMTRSSFYSRYDSANSTERSPVYGIAAMLLTTQHRLNNWTHWQSSVRPYIQIAGAGGREKMRNTWKHTEPQTLGQNSTLFNNIVHRLPIRILVEDTDIVGQYVYTGLWYVYRSEMLAGTSDSDGQPVFITTVVRHDDLECRAVEQYPGGSIAAVHKARE